MFYIYPEEGEMEIDYKALYEKLKDDWDYLDKRMNTLHEVQKQLHDSERSNSRLIEVNSYLVDRLGKAKEKEAKYKSLVMEYEEWCKQMSAKIHLTEKMKIALDGLLILTDKLFRSKD